MEICVLIQLIIASLTVYCCLNKVHGSVIVLDATPNDIKAGSTRTLTLQCSLNDTAASNSTSLPVIGKRDVTNTSDNVAEVSSIIVMLGGKDVAMVSHAPAKVMDGSTNTKVSGQVSGIPGQPGFIELIIDWPTKEQTGEYSCEILALRGGHAIVFSTTAEVTGSVPSIADMMLLIHENEKICADFNKKHEETEQKLEKEVDVLRQELAHLKTDVGTPVILFFVGSTKELSIPAGQTIIYDKVYTNVGGAYNAASGQFVCTLDGYYQFVVSALSSYDKGGVLHLQLNGIPTFTIYLAASNSHQGMSNSGVVKLSKGDAVRVVAYHQSSLTNNPAEVYATFSGHFVSPI